MNDKNNSKITKSISNPFSTGGGGATFENLVGAYYVSQLLSDKLIYGHLEAGTVKEIAFQNRWIGLDVDDIIIYGSTKIISEKPKNNIRPKLILQIKNRLNFRLSDTKFINVIKECWQTFNHSSFNLKYDQIGLMLGILNLKVKKHFLRLLEWAKTSDSFTEFFSKINVINYASQEMRDYIDMIKIILPKANEENLWKFLQHLNVLELDLISSNSKTYLDSVENLRSIVINHDFKKAIALFSYILERCAYYNKNGGRISFNTLYQDITANSFLERRNIKNYWERKWGMNINPEFLVNLGRLTEESGELRKEFNHRLFILEQKRTEEIKDQIDYIKNVMIKNKSEDLLNSLNVLEYQLAFIKSVCVLAIFNQLSERILEFFRKGFILSMRIQESCRFVTPSIYNAIGMEATIPYVESEFFSHKLQTILERYFEQYPEFRESITHFYHGFILGLVDSQFFDSTVIHTIELGLGFIYHLGYKPLEKKEDIYYYDLTNQFILELCQKLAVTSPKDLGQPTSFYITVFRRILDFVSKRTVKFKNNNPLVIGVKLYTLGELFSLPIPIKMRTPILQQFIIVLKDLVKEMKKHSISHVFFFSILQKIWAQIFSTSSEIIPKIYRSFLSELITLYSTILSLRIKTEISKMSHPFIDQMNRTFIDLLYYLIRIFKEELKTKENLIDIYNILNKGLLKIGDDLFKNYPDKEFYKWILEPLAIMRFLMIYYRIQKNSAIISKGDIFDSLCSIGTLILMDAYPQKDKKSKIIYQYKSEIQEFITKVFPLEDIHNCIECRQGSWKIFGYSIGSDILLFHSVFSNPEIVYRAINSLTFIEKQ